ncbi:MAG: hypothetical protein CMB53_01265 [Euryarchaeota archaeon]|nr:hypothetical protein [Euryarchaeota archaeon]|tara:strand:- start:2230 stop:3219 length:990 start_codon:yes stop_codon:yes gene_type:complete
MSTDTIGDKLQHPRRSLGNRHRSQAVKYLKIINGTESDSTNLGWAEQNARQAVLHDFTHPENWRVLLEVKSVSGDRGGIRAVLDDIFTVLGRDPELLNQLDDVDMLESGSTILEGTLAADPLDPDEWWQTVSGSNEEVSAFISRVKTLDLRDRRANVLFSRRIERVRDSGDEDGYLSLARLILAQRPTNFEAWAELGRMHERRGEYRDAWLCYDQAQTQFPKMDVRDQFKDRMEALLDGGESEPWIIPAVNERIDFLRKMESMATPVPMGSEEDNLEEEVEKEPLEEVRDLMEDGKLSEAFFVARRLAAEGLPEAIEIAEEIRREIGNE